MMLIYGVVLVALIYGTVSDLKTREVPDWLNYSLVASGLGLSAIVSLIEGAWQPITFSVAGLAVSYGLGALMFYTGQWGGGDSKMIIGLGALLGLDFTSLSSVPFMVGFWINALFVGAFYGLIWSVVLAVLRFGKFHRAFVKQVKSAKYIHYVAWVLAFGLVVLGVAVQDLMLRLLGFGFAVLVPLFFYTWAFVKAVESACMIRDVHPSMLTEGDWIVDDVVVGGERVTGPKDLGISKQQIATLVKKKVKSVRIKEGIPFVPSFLIAFLLSLTVGNLLNILLGVI